MSELCRCGKVRLERGEAVVLKRALPGSAHHDDGGDVSDGKA
jgi:hypothetical protein